MQISGKTVWSSISGPFRDWKFLFYLSRGLLYIRTSKVNLDWTSLDWNYLHMPDEITFVPQSVQRVKYFSEMGAAGFSAAGTWWKMLEPTGSWWIGSHDPMIPIRFSAPASRSKDFSQSWLLVKARMTCPIHWSTDPLIRSLRVLEMWRHPKGKLGKKTKQAQEKASSTSLHKMWCMITR